MRECFLYFHTNWTKTQQIENEDSCTAFSHLPRPGSTVPATVLEIRVWQTEIGNYRSFLPFYPNHPPPPTPRSFHQNFKKMKKMLEISSFYTCVPKNTIILLPNYWSQKLKFGKNVKKRRNVILFYTCEPYMKII